MTTMQVLGVGYRAARQAARERRAARSGAQIAHLSIVRIAAEHGLAIAGFACFTIAALMVAVPLGLAVAGVSLFILELRAGE